jgi:prepilin-type N-terminal cleavage/methylation domain-containing protein
MMETSSRGFTLIETLIAVAILMTGAAAIASLFISSIRVNVDNRDRLNATLLASEKMEELRQTASAENGAELVLIPGTSLMYKREWHIEGAVTRTVIVAVTVHEKELARISTTVSPKW